VILNRAADVAVVWIVVFRDDESARQFEESYRAMLDRVRASTPHHIERRSSSVLVIAGSIANQVSTLAPAIWKASKIGQIKPPALSSPPAKTQAFGSGGVASTHP